jgi:hypothetical protein
MIENLSAKFENPPISRKRFCAWPLAAQIFLVLPGELLPRSLGYERCPPSRRAVITKRQTSG